MFLWEKKEEGRFRMILNLKELNQWLEYAHCKMDILELTLKLVTQGVSMTSLDFKDGYYSLAIHQVSQSRKYLRLFSRTL